MQRVLGILLRPTCVSIAVSDKHLSQAAPVGAVLLRDMRVPTRVLARMLAPYSKELTGVVWGECMCASKLGCPLCQLEPPFEPVGPHPATSSKLTLTGPAHCLCYRASCGRVLGFMLGNLAAVHPWCPKH